jgi:putative tryptophan/tyrosine transport system substrate-binding protein
LCGDWANWAGVEGRTVAIEYRRTDARKECFGEIAAEYARRKVDTLSGTAIATAKQETSTIPIVFAVAVDPERN